MAGVFEVGARHHPPAAQQHPTSHRLDHLEQEHPMNDASLADNTPSQDTPVPAGGVFGTPTPEPTPPAIRKQWTVEEILQAAKLPEKYARICLRADLEAEHQQILAELAALVDANGQLIVDDDRAAGEESPTTHAQALSDRLDRVATQMREHTVWFLFRGKSQEAMGDFNDKHLPKPDKDGNQDLREYNAHLVAETAVDPALTVDQVRALRGKLGPAAYAQLTQTAQTVCIRGGVDIPKSPAFSLTPKQT